MPNTVLGKVSCVPRGDYSASATYTVLDIAGYQGGSYMALKTVTGVTPSNDGINWMQLSGTGSGDFMADGSVPMTGALQMGGNKITNLGAPGADTDAVRKQDLDAVADEVDKILDGTTPAYIPPATTAKLGGVIVGDGLSVEADGTVSAESQLPAGGTNGQILTKTANGETWADPPDTGVTTFNNRSGAVVPKTGDYTAEMVGAVPTTRTVNGHALSDNISLTAEDVGAMANPSGGSDGQMLYKTASGAEWGIPPYLGSMPQLDSAQMKSLHALGITDLNNVTEPGTYVGMGGESTGYPTVSNIPSEVANSPFILNVYTLTAPVDSVYAGNTAIIQECRGIVSMLNGEPKVFYRVASYIETVGSWGGWTRPVSVASSTEFTPTSSIVSTNVQDAIAEVQGNVDAAKPVLRTATLTTSGWSGNSQTVTVSGVLADPNAQLIYVAPADKASAAAWGAAGVFCSAQGANSLTFVCDAVPTQNISVNISIQEAQ